MESIRIVREEVSEFRVLILGPLEVYRDGRPVDVERRQKTAGTLLRLLGTAPGWRRSYEELVEILWPEATPRVGSANLRTTIHTLRHSLGAGEPSPICSERGWVYLNQAHTWVIDSDQLQSVMDERDPALDSLEAALALYRGEPLPENRYDDWAMRVRGRLQRAHRAAALRLIVALAGAGQLERARSHAEMLLDDDPLDEEAEYSLLTVLAEMDLRVEAIRRYDKFERRLHAELGVAPDLRLQRVARSLRSALGAD